MRRTVVNRLVVALGLVAALAAGVSVPAQQQIARLAPTPQDWSLAYFNGYYWNNLYPYEDSVNTYLRLAIEDFIQWDVYNGGGDYPDVWMASPDWWWFHPWVGGAMTWLWDHYGYPNVDNRTNTIGAGGGCRNCYAARIDMGFYIDSPFWFFTTGWLDTQSDLDGGTYDWDSGAPAFKPLLKFAGVNAATPVKADVQVYGKGWEWRYSASELYDYMTGWGTEEPTRHWYDIGTFDPYARYGDRGTPGWTYWCQIAAQWVDSWEPTAAGTGPSRTPAAGPATRLRLAPR